MPPHDRTRSFLRQLRDDAGLTQEEVARRAGISQGKVSKLERGTLALTDADVAAFARVFKLNKAAGERLAAAAVAAQEIPRRVILARGGAAYQRRVGEHERASQHVATFHPAMVTGLLQTEAYARTVFSSGDLSPADVDAATAARMDRQQLIAEDDGRRWTQVLTEGALTWLAGSAELMADQLDHLVDVATAGGNLRLGLIPRWRPVAVFPMHGFQLFDERAVEVGTTSGTAWITDPADVRDYVAMLAQLEQLALFGPDAVPELRRIADDTRGACRGR